MTKMFVRKGSDISTIALEGSSIGFEKGLRHYQEKGKFRKGADFGPILLGNGGITLISGNLYFPETCMLFSYYQPELKELERDTVVYCHGTSYDWVHRFTEDFIRSIELKIVEPDERIIDCANDRHEAFEEAWEFSREIGRDEQKELFAEAFRDLNSYKQHLKIKMN